MTRRKTGIVLNYYWLKNRFQKSKGISKPYLQDMTCRMFWSPSTLLLLELQCSERQNIFCVHLDHVLWDLWRFVREAFCRHWALGVPSNNMWKYLWFWNREKGHKKARTRATSLTMNYLEKQPSPTQSARLQKGWGQKLFQHHCKKTGKYCLSCPDKHSVLLCRHQIANIYQFCGNNVKKVTIAV